MTFSFRPVLSSMLILTKPLWMSMGQRGTPAEVGQKLAVHALTWIPPLSEIRVDLKGTPPALLIGSFFFGFLQRIHDEAPKRLKEARKITWLTDFNFQQKFISSCMTEFTPN